MWKGKVLTTGTGQKVSPPLLLKEMFFIISNDKQANDM